MKLEQTYWIKRNGNKIQFIASHWPPELCSKGQIIIGKIYLSSFLGYVYWPAGYSSGEFDSATLRAIAAQLDKLNKAYGNKAKS